MKENQFRNSGIIFDQNFLPPLPGRKFFPESVNRNAVVFLANAFYSSALHVLARVYLSVDTPVFVCASFHKVKIMHCEVFLFLS